MTDEKQPIESPSGLELHPEPPPTARISKKVGVAVLGVVVVVGVLVVYGLYARREQQQVAQTQNEEKHPESARSIGDQLVKELPAPRSRITPASSRTDCVDPARGSGGIQCTNQVACSLPGWCITPMRRGFALVRAARAREQSVHWWCDGNLS